MSYPKMEGCSFMFEVSEKAYTLGKTKSSDKWQIRKLDAEMNRSYCEHNIVREIKENVSFDDFGPVIGNLCVVCYDTLTFGAIRDSKKWKSPFFKLLKGNTKSYSSKH
jgi:hypothetical protein